MKMLLLLCFWGVVSATTDEPRHHPTAGIVDNKRPCPDGFFYAGEASFHEIEKKNTRGFVWADKGPATPVYSCYRIENGLDWASANRRCWDKESQLVSVNNPNENLILFSDKFKRKFRYENELPNNVLTSGVNLGDGHWFWFATGESLNETQTTNLSSNSSCVLLSWRGSSLTYHSIPCVETANFTAVCEVRVYVQTWYVWFFDNWLQLLFLFTLVLLIVSACLTLQVWTSRTSRRPATSATTASNNNNTSGFNNNKYIHKGKELLAKVVFYSPSKTEDKEKLTTKA